MKEVEVLINLAKENLDYYAGLSLSVIEARKAILNLAKREKNYAEIDSAFGLYDGQRKHMIRYGALMKAHQILQDLTSPHMPHNVETKED